ncbi:hypothetical protein FQA47_024232 [Oryzias melastigma]|uniref:Uncharacterized protein n=1 Tax=Oryzias melastigma TaxID=30732 RepID=A0A834BQR0_ORYME|nr:hypothetical protein FQA47_024232 [Oryzias melastigma]
MHVEIRPCEITCEGRSNQRRPPSQQEELLLQTPSQVHGRIVKGTGAAVTPPPHVQSINPDLLFSHRGLRTSASPQTVCGSSISAGLYAVHTAAGSTGSSGAGSDGGPAVWSAAPRTPAAQEDGYNGQGPSSWGGGVKSELMGGEEERRASRNTPGSSCIPEGRKGAAPITWRPQTSHEADLSSETFSWTDTVFICSQQTTEVLIQKTTRKQVSRCNNPVSSLTAAGFGAEQHKPTFRSAETLIKAVVSSEESTSRNPAPDSSVVTREPVSAERADLNRTGPCLTGIAHLYQGRPETVRTSSAPEPALLFPNIRAPSVTETSSFPEAHSFTSKPSNLARDAALICTEMWEGGLGSRFSSSSVRSRK